MISEETLNQLLYQEQQAAEQLLALIEQEFELLSKGDIDNLQPLVDKKNQQILTLQAASQQRESFLVQNGYEPDLQGLKNCINTYSNNEKTSQLLQKIISIAEKCQHTNQMNGRLVRQKQLQSHNALNILQGHNNLPTDTYTQQGTTNISSHSRTLGKA